MKQDVNNTLNKLVAYAYDNLLLDTLDGVYALNRLAAVCGVKAPAIDNDADYGDADISALLDELAAAVPSLDKTAVMQTLFPMPRTVNYYFGEKLARGADKAFDFLFGLYANGYDCISTVGAASGDGYYSYADAPENVLRCVTLDADGELVYTPRAVGDRVASLENPDILTDELVSREAAFVSNYGGAIAVRPGESEEYYTCADFALTHAPVKTQISDGAVKTELLDYPVPVLAFGGIAKNAVARETARVLKAATDAGRKCVLAAAAKNGVTFYLVFAGDVKPDEAGLIHPVNTPLYPCGVFRTANCSALLSVLEKGTALSTDLAPFRSIYDKIGGVKLGAEKAKTELGGALRDIFKARLAEAKTAEEAEVVSFAEAK